MKVKINFVSVFSILTIIVVFLFCYIYNCSSYIVEHDSFWPYQFSFDNLPPSRYPALILSYLYNVFLPRIFNTNPNDFRSSIIGCSLISFYYFSIIWIISRSFFIFSDNSQKSIMRYENIFIIPICFLFLTMANNDPRLYFQGISYDVQVYLDHVGGCLFYFLFFVVLMKTIICDKKFTVLEKIFYSISAFILGLWTEILNLSVLFSIFIIYMFLYCLNKEKLKNTFIYYLFGSFLIGIFLYYFVLSNFSLHNVGSIGQYDIIARLGENLSGINVFLTKFINLYITNKINFWIIIFVLTLIIEFQIHFKPQLSDVGGERFSNLENYKKNVNLILIILFCIVAGFFLADFCSLFVANYRSGHETYMMERNTFLLIMDNILIYTIITLCGIIYYNQKNKNKNIIAYFCFCLVIIITFFLFLPDYIIQIKNRINGKFLLYNVEKTIVVYSILGESAILPLNVNNTFLDIVDQGKMIDNVQNFSDFYKNKYFNRDYFVHRFYYDAQYKHRVKGIRFVDDGYAFSQLNERMKLFGRQDKEKTKFPIIKFSDINMYDNYNLTLDDIDKKEKQFGKNDILLKARAYINYRDENYQEAIKLYKQYLQNNPNDYDALINLGEIYKKQNDFKEAENIYKRLINIDNRHYFFNFNLMNIYYMEKNYEKALSINNRLLNESESFLYFDKVTQYINQAIIYNAMNNVDKTKEYIEYAELEDIGEVQNYVSSIGLEQLGDIINTEKEILLKNPFE